MLVWFMIPCDSEPVPTWKELHEVPGKDLLQLHHNTSHDFSGRSWYAYNMQKNVSMILTTCGGYLGFIEPQLLQ